MIKITLSGSLKRIICDTLTERINMLKSGVKTIKSTSNKLDFELSITPNEDARTLPIKIAELENLSKEIIDLLPNILYLSNVKLN